MLLKLIFITNMNNQFKTYNSHFFTNLDQFEFNTTKII